MEIQNKVEFINEVISRVVNNAPISEVLRVYSLSVQAAVEAMEDGDLIQAVLNAGYTDILERYYSPEEILAEDLDEILNADSEE